MYAFDHLQQLVVGLASRVQVVVGGFRQRFGVLGDGAHRTADFIARVEDDVGQFALMPGTHRRPVHELGHARGTYGDADAHLAGVCDHGPNTVHECGHVVHRLAENRAGDSGARFRQICPQLRDPTEVGSRRIERCHDPGPEPPDGSEASKGGEDGEGYGDGTTGAGQDRPPREHDQNADQAVSGEEGTGKGPAGAGRG